jgi:hypothetical protein
MKLGKTKCYYLAVNSRTAIQTRQKKCALGSTLQDLGERGASPAAVATVATTLFLGGQKRRPPGQRAASWRTAQEAERLLTSVQQQPHEDTGERRVLWTKMTTQGSRADACFQHQHHNTQKYTIADFGFSRFTLVNSFFKCPWPKRKGTRIRKAMYRINTYANNILIFSTELIFGLLK